LFVFDIAKHLTCELGKRQESVPISFIFFIARFAQVTTKQSLFCLQQATSYALIKLLKFSRAHNKADRSSFGVSQGADSKSIFNKLYGSI
jgi:hypothetical protein